MRPGIIVTSRTYMDSNLDCSRFKLQVATRIPVTSSRSRCHDERHVNSLIGLECINWMSTDGRLKHDEYEIDQWLKMGEARHESGEHRGFDPWRGTPQTNWDMVSIHVCSIFEWHLWFFRIFQVAEEIISMSFDPSQLPKGFRAKSSVWSVKMKLYVEC